MDIDVSFPGHGRIEFRSRFLFSDAREEHCQSFVERVFTAKQVQSVTVQTTKRLAEIRYCTESISHEQAINIIRRCLSNGNGQANGTSGSAPFYG